MNTIVAIPFDESLAEFVGKKGSENSITFYNRKLDNNVIVGLAPTSIEEKFYAVPQSLVMSDQALVSTKSIDKIFGEVLIGCSLLNKRTVFTKDNDISSMLAGITFKNFVLKEQEEILDAIISHEQKENNGNKLRVYIDKAFNVKGVGTVALGIVKSGKLKVHDTLYHNSGKQAMVRSIQSQDENIKEAEKGTRVGLALKGIDEKDMEKGDILSNEQIKSSKSLELKITTSNFAHEQIEKGKAYFISIGFSNVNLIVDSIEKDILKVNLDKSIPVEIGDEFLLVRTLSPRIFASGKVAGIY